MDHVAMLILRQGLVERVTKLLLTEQSRVRHERKPFLLFSRRRDGRRIICHDSRDGRAARDWPRTASPIASAQSARKRRYSFVSKLFGGQNLESVFPN